MPSRAEIEHLLGQLEDASQQVARAMDANFLDSRTTALVSIGAAVCVDASIPTLRTLVTRAIGAGASEDEVLGAFLAVGALAGEPRIVSVTPRLSLALGYDIDRALEHE